MTIINHKQKFCFIHIRKTGGTSIATEILKNHNVLPGHVGFYTDGECFDHASAFYMSQKFSNKWKTYFSFSIVRNPWDRLVSRYFWSKNNQKALRDKECRTFPHFVDRLIERKPIFKSDWKHWEPNLYSLTNGILLPQYDMLFSPNGNQLVNYVGKFENLSQSFNHVANKIGLLEPSLPWENKAQRSSYQKYYTSGARKWVEQKYKKDIEYFGYEFEE